MSDDAASIDLVAQFTGADRVTITDNVARRLGVVVSPPRLEALWTVLAELGDGWSMPARGVPVAKLRLNFSQGDEPHGNLGVGRNFLAAHVFGSFLARHSDRATAVQILRSIGQTHLSVFL